MSSISRYLKDNRKRHLSQLCELLSIPSVSTDSEHAGEVRRAAGWVRDRLRAVGCTKVKVHATPRHPIVYGEWLGAPGGPTVLVYGHYDVQPVDPIDLWKTPPFKPIVRAGRVYARGAADDKGQFMTHVNALEAHLETNGTCPVNVKFLIEGEEEIGSPSLESHIKKHKRQLAADAVIVSDTAMFAKGLPSICYGLRGLAYMEVTVCGSSRDLHSGSFGGSVVNPALALTEMLAKLKTARGKITIPGFYDDVRKLTAAERRAFRALPHSDLKYRRAIGVPELFGESGFSTLERLWARPSLDINGIWSGFTGEGAKTVIPALAHAKVSMRLVPDQNPNKIARQFNAYLKKIAPKSVKVSVRSLHGAEPWIAPTDHPAMAAAGRALERAFGKKPVLVREGGSIPVVATFEQLLGIPTVLMGFGLNDDNLHAPNEKMDLDNFYGGISASAFMLEELGANGGRPRAGKKKRPAARARR